MNPIIRGRNLEVFSAGCPLCEETIRLVQNLDCGSCEITVLDMRDTEVASRATALGVRSVPAVAIDGKLADCCVRAGPDETILSAAGCHPHWPRRYPDQARLHPVLPSPGWHNRQHILHQAGLSPPARAPFHHNLCDAWFNVSVPRKGMNMDWKEQLGSRIFAVAVLLPSVDAAHCLC